VTISLSSARRAFIVRRAWLLLFTISTRSPSVNNLELIRTGPAMLIESCSCSSICLVILISRSSNSLICLSEQSCLRGEEEVGEPEQHFEPLIRGGSVDRGLDLFQSGSFLSAHCRHCRPACPNFF
jgi:hypothetical protein